MCVECDKSKNKNKVQKLRPSLPNTNHGRLYTKYNLTLVPQPAPEETRTIHFSTQRCNHFLIYSDN